MRVPFTTMDSGNLAASRILETGKKTSKNLIPFNLYKKENIILKF